MSYTDEQVSEITKALKEIGLMDSSSEDEEDPSPPVWFGRRKMATQIDIDTKFNSPAHPSNIFDSSSMRLTHRVREEDCYYRGRCSSMDGGMLESSAHKWPVIRTQSSPLRQQRQQRPRSDSLKLTLLSRGELSETMPCVPSPPQARTPYISLKEAAERARRKKVLLFGLDSEDLDAGMRESSENSSPQSSGRSTNHSSLRGSLNRRKERSNSLLPSINIHVSIRTDKGSPTATRSPNGI
ncbi:hypothetical protein CAPTEDRAFT_200231 [Capitella teleta]|uniref:Uncharacterized protein n=1 Tax=Capitella teleta TaxID=283909 RepID=R7UWZ8_CAPTE|nr:hypothetical protein CAPTEDRAFT_200231 [Capitella teleta]|eukprot:ELU10792.1 hypothetical protein CAPTEDRAFT_200231 [Capitella teleta]